MGFFEIYLLNIDHPDVEASILSEIASGVDVYYDCRWEAAEALSNFLLDEPRWVAHRHILVIGAGLGMETVVIGKLCDKLYVNDLALVALALCSLQLKKNEVKNFEIMHGNYACIPCPQVDMVIGCFVVYNAKTLDTMKIFLNACSHPVLLMNEPLPAFQRLIRKTPKTMCELPFQDPFRCVLFL